MDEGLEELVLAGAKAADMKRYLAAKGMRILAADGLAKAALGITTIAEVAREVGF
jgi:type II secretory ATPase GspE/PulE/Tfp pilus assembly ATPase PilB-like protein